MRNTFAETFYQAAQRDPRLCLVVADISPAGAIDKFRTAQQAAIKSNPFFGPAFNSMTDFTGHRDMIFRTNATYK